MKRHRAPLLVTGIAAAGLLTADFFLPHEGHFGFDGLPGFKGLLALVAVALGTLAAAGIRALLRRPEDHYRD